MSSQSVTNRSQPAPGEGRARGRGAIGALAAAGKSVVFLAVASAVLFAGTPGSASRVSLPPMQLNLPSPYSLFRVSEPGPAPEVAGDPSREPEEVVQSPPTATPTEIPPEEMVLIEAAEIRERSATPVIPEGPAPAKALQIGTYKVKEGDTLLALAVQFRITPETILWANDLGNGELLRVGQELAIPPVSGILHTARKGETVDGIAEAYFVETGVVAAANGLAAGVAPTEGQVLIIPGGVRRTTEPIEGLPSPPSQDELAAAPRYTVRPGDTVVSIADAFGVRPSIIQVANGLLDPDLLHPGQLLVVPGGKPGAAPRPPGEVKATATAAGAGPTRVAATPVPAAPTRTAAPTAAPQPPAGGQGTYVVKAGDTFYSIARALGVSVSSLQDANGIADPSKIRVGQTLSVPSGARPASATAASTPAPTATRAAPTPTVAPTPQPPTPTPRPPQAAPPTATQPPQRSQPSGNPSTGERIAALAQKYLGHRYVWGGHSPTGFDCSGFTWYVYREAGLSIPQHSLQGQLGAGRQVPRDQLAPGDLVFFRDTYSPGLSHAGIYLGGGRFINAETEKVGVQVRALADPYWSARFHGASRPW